MSDDMVTTCVSIVRRGDAWHLNDGPCGNKAKGVLASGLPACGTHLRSERLQTEQANKITDLMTRIMAINEALGIGASRYWDRDGMVVVPIADLERLAERAITHD